MTRNGTPVSTASTAVRTALYRHFDAEGNLLYVGISLNAVARLIQHRMEAQWFDRIARIELEWHDSRQAAFDAERRAIRDERPLHNVIHYGMPDELRRMLLSIGKLHMVDADGMLLPEFYLMTEAEVTELADRL